MRIVNYSKGVTVSRHAELRASFLGRLRGLILSKRKDIILVAPVESVNASSIHMFGVLYPIDVIWLDSKKMVVDFRKKIKPFNSLNPKTWKIYKPGSPAKYVVELCVGKIGNMARGDVMEFK